MASSPPVKPSSSKSSLFCAIGSPQTSISNDTLRHQVDSFLATLGDREDVLILPPDFTRYHSQAGLITRYISEYYNYTAREDEMDMDTEDEDTNSGEDVIKLEDTSNKDDATSATISSCATNIQIIPALGTHAPMTTSQIRTMFGSNLASKEPSPFIVHNWREDVITIGHVPKSLVSDATYGMVNEKWPAQLNKLVWEKRISHHNNSGSNSTGDVDGDACDKKKKPPLVISVGQVVPHEVLGMANYNKNLFVGVGGLEAINLSHFIGAVHGMEKLMGRGHNPLRSILNHASEHYLQDLDLWYILTVMGTNDTTNEVEMKGLYIGNDIQCYDMACNLSLQVNFNLLDRSPQKIVVYLNDEYHSTWLGNKSIYRTRMAIDDGGELIVLAPFVETFGEDGQIDELIRKVGYVGTPTIMEAMKQNEDLKENLSAVAHLIHGSSEGRFSITYCPGKLSKEEIESVGFQYLDLDTMKARYDINTLKDGWNTEMNESGKEEEFYYISNPALGLWAVPSRFEDDDSSTSSTFNKKQKIASTEIISNNQKASDMSGGVGGWKLAS